MDVIEAIHRRRTIRAYRDEPVDRALLEQVLWAAVQAPTPPISSESPWKLCVIEGADRLAQYGARAKQYAFANQPPGQRWSWTERPDFKVFWNAPAVVLFCSKGSNPESPYDCCRAAQNMLIAAHGLGLGTCWIGAPIPWLTSAGGIRGSRNPCWVRGVRRSLGRLRCGATNWPAQASPRSILVLARTLTPNPSIEGMPKRLRLLRTPHVKRYAP